MRKFSDILLCGVCYKSDTNYNSEKNPTHFVSKLIFIFVVKKKKVYIYLIEYNQNGIPPFPESEASASMEKNCINNILPNVK